MPRRVERRRPGLPGRRRPAPGPNRVATARSWPTKSFPRLSRRGAEHRRRRRDARTPCDLAEGHSLWRAALRSPRDGGDYRQEAKGYRIADYADVILAMTELVEAGQLGRAFLDEAIDKCESFRSAA